MNKPIHYSDEPLGEFNIVADFLPPPEELSIKAKNIEITISLSKESLDYFKMEADKYHIQYQNMIQKLLDTYVNQQKFLAKHST
ncbi:conserved hypothetical protein [Beggiatoa sp. PS]|nr:conserved hypothetical protein [Beggiatoa sp. PS]